MEKQERKKLTGRQLALCGMMTALSAVLLELGGAVPFGTYACPLLAMTALVPVLEECGSASAFIAWAAAGLLGLFLCPDRETALFFVFLGWYPVLRPRLDRIHPRALSLAVKLLLMNAAVAAMYGLILFVFRLDGAVSDYESTSRWLTALTLLLGNAVFALYDLALCRVTLLYRKKWRKRFFRRSL
mgnify:CR=1 FL=1